MEGVKIVVHDAVPALLFTRTERIHVINDVSVTAYVRIKAYTSPGAHASVARGSHHDDVVVGARRLKILARAVLSCQTYSILLRGLEL